LRQDKERKQERRCEKKQSSSDQIFSRPGAQQKCGNAKQQCTAEVQQTKIVRDNECDAKYGRGDNNTNPERDESYLPTRAMCGH